MRDSAAENSRARGLPQRATALMPAIDTRHDYALCCRHSRHYAARYSDFICRRHASAFALPRFDAVCSDAAAPPCAVQRAPPA